MRINSPISVGNFLVFVDSAGSLMTVFEGGKLANEVLFKLVETPAGLIPNPLELRVVISSKAIAELRYQNYFQVLRDWSRIDNTNLSDFAVDSNTYIGQSYENPLSLSNGLVKRAQIATHIAINKQLLNHEETLNLLNLASQSDELMKSLPYTKSQFKSYLEQIVSVVHYEWAIVNELNPNQEIALKMGINSNRARNLIMFARRNDFLTQSNQGAAFGLATHTFFQILQEITSKAGALEIERT